MSTKVYYAWKFKSASLGKFHRFIEESLPELLDIQRRLIYYVVAGSGNLEDFSKEQHINIKKKLRKVMHRYTSAVQQKSSDQVSSEESETLECAKRLLQTVPAFELFPVRGGIVVLLETGPTATYYLGNVCWNLYKNFLDEKLPQWGYWNNSDRPESISRSEWQSRRYDWEKIVFKNYNFGYKLPYKVEPLGSPHAVPNPKWIWELDDALEPGEPDE